MLADLELALTAYSAHRMRKFQPGPGLIQEIDKMPPPAPPCPRGKLHLHVTQKPAAAATTANPAGAAVLTRSPSLGGVVRPGTQLLSGSAGGVASPQQPRLAAQAPTMVSASSGAVASVSGAATRPSTQLHLVQQSGTLHAVSVTSGEASLKESVEDKSGAAGEGRSIPINNQDGTSEFCWQFTLYFHIRLCALK